MSIKNIRIDRYLIICCFTILVICFDSAIGQEGQKLRIERNAKDGKLDLYFWSDSSNLQKAVSESAASDSLSKVASVWIQYHTLTFDEAKTIAGISGLTILKVGSDTDPVSIDPAALDLIVKLSKLQELELHVDANVDFSGKDFSSLTGLKSLAITVDGPIDTNSFSTLVQAKKLEELSITADEVPTNLQFVCELKSLKYVQIWIRGN